MGSDLYFPIIRRMGPSFEPVPRIWRFHAIYLVVTLVLGLSTFPYPVFASMFLVAAVCLLGLITAMLNWALAAHILAVAIGLGTPVVFVGRLTTTPTLVIFTLLIAGVYVGRKFLF